MSEKIAKSVGDGGTLPSPLRKEMQVAALTPELAAQQRAAALLAKFCAGGDLTAPQWEEVRGAHPGFAAAPPPPSAIAVPDPNATHGDEGPADFTLEPSRAKLTREDQETFSKLYGKGWRQIRRWVEQGELHRDPCPLHDPAAMPAWWSRRMKWRVPSEILEAASRAAKDAPAPASAAQLASPESPAPASSPPPAGGATAPKYNLADFDPEEGDRLRGLLRIQGVKFAELSAVIESGGESAHLEQKYLALCNTIDKIETRATERLKKQRLYILRAEVEADLAANAELLRQTRESMARRVSELCPSLTADQRIEVSAAVLRARAGEEKLLCRLPTLTADEFNLALAS